MSDDVEAKVPQRGRGCLTWFLILIFGLPLAIIAIAVLLFGWRDMAAQRQLEERVAKLQSQGLPVDYDSAAVYHAELTSEESVGEWLEVLALVDGEELIADSKGIPIIGIGPEPPYPKHGEPWSEEAAVREFLDKYDSLHNRIMRLSLKSQPVRFPIEWEGVGTLLPDTQRMRAAARLLNLRGQLALYDRDPAAVRRSVDALVGCAVVLEGEPSLVSQFVSIAIGQTAMSVLKDGVQQDVFRPDDLRYLIERLSPLTNLREHWRVGLNGERAMMLPIYREPSSLESYGPGEGFATRLPFRGRDANAYLDIIEQALDADTTSLDAFSRDVQAIEEKVETDLTSDSILQQLDHALTAMLTPALGQAGRALVGKATDHRIAVIAMAIRLYENEQGAFPNSLSELESVGVSASDFMPPGGQPFGYDLVDGKAYLWGFNHQLGESSVPTTRPVVTDGEAHAEAKRLAIWELTPHQ
ncbi:MAG: hypothetical protein Aurels2KO_51480 [Aureliella sp.]